jgi:hypothetical protein
MQLKELILGLALASAVTAPGAQALVLWGNSAGGSITLEGFDPTTGAVVHQFSEGGGNGRGVVVVGNTIYWTRVGDGNLYKADATTGAPLGSIATGQSSLATIAYDGTNFWLGDYSGTSKAYHFNLSTGMVDKTISLANCQGNCDGLEFFQRGATGFLISNRYDGGFGGANTYDIYDLNGNLVTPGFITGHVTSGNTGIAYDGTNFYISDIFNNSVSEFNGVTGAFMQTITLGGPIPSGGRELEDLSFDYSQVIPVPTPLVGRGLSVLLAVGGILLGAKLLERSRKRRSSGIAPAVALRRLSQHGIT